MTISFNVRCDCCGAHFDTKITFYHITMSSLGKNQSYEIGVDKNNNNM